MNDVYHKISFQDVKNIFKKDKLKYYLNKLINLKAPPSKIALSISLGIFIGLLIPMGLQTFIVIPMAMILGCNVIVAYAGTLVSNPLTVIPIYYLSVKIGSYMTDITFTWEQFNNVIVNPTYENILRLGGDGVIVFFSGSFVQAVILSILFYLISLQTIIYFRSRKHNLSE